MLNRRTCSFFRDYILDLLESDRKFLVFAHHKDMLDAICNCLTQKVKYSGNLPYGHLVTTFFLSRRNAHTFSHTKTPYFLPPR